MGEWTTGLIQHGLYWEGWVTDIDSVLGNHSKATVTCYGTRRSSKASGCIGTGQLAHRSVATAERKENTPGVVPVGDKVSYN